MRREQLVKYIICLFSGMFLFMSSTPNPNADLSEGEKCKEVIKFKEKLDELEEHFLDISYHYGIK